MIFVIPKSQSNLAYNHLFLTHFNESSSLFLSGSVAAS